MNQYGDPDYAYHAALAKILALYIVQLSANEFLPYRFSELSSYARQALFDLNLPGTTSKPLEAAFDEFDKVATRIDSIISSGKVSALQSAKVNALFVKAMNAFRADPNVPVLPFHQRSALVGASPKNGCGSEPLPGLSLAVADADSKSIQRETERLVQAFRSATSILSETEALLVQKRK
jgi:hypothetical protein